MIFFLGVLWWMCGAWIVLHDMHTYDDVLIGDLWAVFLLANLGPIAFLTTESFNELSDTILLKKKQS